MGKKKLLTEVQRAQIVILHKEGASEHQITAHLSVSKTGVHQAITKHVSEGIFCDKKCSGRPRKTSIRDVNLIQRMVVRSPTNSTKKLQAALLRKGMRVTQMTISQRLSRKFNLKSYKPAQKPRLTPVMKTKRLAFAKKHHDWTIQQWSKVLFSDEQTFQQFVVRKRHVRSPPGKRYDDKYMVSTMKHPPSQMIWGAISQHGIGGLFFLPCGTTMNDEKYVQLLSDKLQLHMQVHRCNIFMQDGASCHRSKLVTTFLKKKKVKVLNWHGNSPDLNPIENLWTVMKDKVAEKQPSSLPDLCQAIKEVWVKEVSKEYCANLVNSMPRRLAAVIQNIGGHTKYWLFENLCYEMSPNKLCCTRDVIDIEKESNKWNVSTLKKVRFPFIRKKQGGLKLLLMTVQLMKN